MTSLVWASTSVAICEMASLLRMCCTEDRHLNPVALLQVRSWDLRCSQLLVTSLCIKPTDTLNSNFIAITTLQVSGSLSAYHQEFLAVHRLWYILCSCDDRLLPGVGWNCSSILLLEVQKERQHNYSTLLSWRYWSINPTVQIWTSLTPFDGTFKNAPFRRPLSHMQMLYMKCVAGCWGLNPGLYCKDVNNLHCEINVVIRRLIWLQNGAGV